MIEDDDYFGGPVCRDPGRGGVIRRETVIERERDRGYVTGRRRGRRIARREADAEVIEDERDREVLFGGAGFGGLAGGFGMGGSGAALVIIGLLLMAMAYFGLGFDGGGGYAAGYSPYDSGGGYTPELAPPGLSDVYGGGDLMAQRPMMFMGGGFLFMTGWLLVIASRLRALMTDDL